MSSSASGTSIVESRFSDIKQQRETATLGIWTFLVSEVMFFGAFLVAYTMCRAAYPQAFEVGSRHTDMLLGTLNTAVLLTSSLFMALAVGAARAAKRGPLVIYLALSALLGVGFLGIKGLEYYHDWQDHLVPGTTFSIEDAPPTVASVGTSDKIDPRPQIGLDAGQPSALPNSQTPEFQIAGLRRVQLFFLFYFFLTGVHALHLTIGICWTGVTALLAALDRLSDGQPVETLGLYWHFVDIVWVFLYPLLYLAGRHS